MQKNTNNPSIHEQSKSKSRAKQKEVKGMRQVNAESSNSGAFARDNTDKIQHIS